ATTDTLDLSLPGNGSNGDTVSVSVTPTDGTLAGSPAADTATVGSNHLPSATVALSPAAPTTNATLTASATSADADRDPVTLSYVWKVDGAVVPGATGATLDLSGAGHGDRGQSVSVTVTPNDGIADGAAATDAAPVADTAPAVDSVAIDQAAPTTDDVLTATIASHDADADPLTYAYQWLRNGSPILGATGPTLDLSGAG